MQLPIAYIHTRCLRATLAIAMLAAWACVPMGGSVTFNRPPDESQKNGRDLPSVDENDGEKSGNGVEGSVPVKMSKNADGSFSAGIVNSGSALAVIAPAGTPLGGSGLVINPDSLANPTVISITEGASLATPANAAKLGIAGSLAAASRTMVVTSSASEDPKAPLTGSLSLSPGAALLMNEGELAVIYHVVVYGKQQKNLLGMIPTALLSIEDGKVNFSAPFFGAFQAVNLPKGSAKQAEVASEEPLTTAAGTTINTQNPGGSNTSNSDTTPPSSTGAVSITSISEFEVGLNVTSASDNVSSPEKLRYRPYYSTSPGLDSVTLVENATPAGDFRPFEMPFRVSGLSLHTPYYFNILVKDEAGNKAIYSSKNFILPSPPVIQSTSPSVYPATGAVFQSYSAPTTYTITANDANPGDIISYSWLLNGIASPALASSGNSATFSPDLTFLGRQVLSVVASDGLKSANFTWNIDVHGFSNACVNLAPGKICTLVGSPDVGSGSYPGNPPSVARISPDKLIEDGSGNLFFTDVELASVWFYNRSAASMTVLGTTVAAGQLKIVAGVGTSSYAVDGSAALQYGLQYPKGLAWDSSRGILYVSDSTAGKIIRFSPTGVGNVIFGNGLGVNNASTNTDGEPGVSHFCLSPGSLSYAQNTDTLYIACVGSWSIKKATNVSSNVVANIQGSIVVGKLSTGATGSGYVEGSMGGGGNAKVTTLAALKFGADGVLYFSEIASGACRIRVANLSGASKTYFSSGNPITIAKDVTGTLIGTGTCGSYSGTVTSATIHNLYDLNLTFDNPGAPVLSGIYAANYLGHTIQFINTSSSSQTFGGVTVTANQIQTIFGTGTGGFNGDSGSGSSTKLYYPSAVAVSASKLIVADWSNKRIRGLNIDVSNGAVSTLAGSGQGISGLSTNAITPATDTKLYSPYSAVATGNTLYIGDTLNYRIKSVDLKYGYTKNAAGTGLQGNGSHGEDVSSTIFQKVKSLKMISNMISNILTVVDSYEAGGTNRNCKVRGINFGNAATDLTSVNIGTNTIGDLAGNYATGCTSWLGNDINVGATTSTASLYIPTDIASNNAGGIFIADSADQCIKLVNNAGLISRFVGLCNSSGAGFVDGLLSSGLPRLSLPNSLAEDPSHPGNIFITDQTQMGTGKIRYLNLSASRVTVFGVDIESSSIGTIHSIPGLYLRGIAAFGSQLCYSIGDYTTNVSNAPHQVVCADRTLSSWVNSLRVGNPSGFAGRAVDPQASEGVNAADAVLAGPARITFDADGNLYIVESKTHQVRKVRRWY